ncbi:MAG: alpha/beta hydrolase [Chroococcales cyanobacterium]
MKFPFSSQLFTFLNRSSTSQIPYVNGDRHSNQHLSLLKSAISSLLLGTVLSTTTVSAAERVNFSYEFLHASVSVSALEAYAEEDKIDEQLAAYFKLLSPEVQ